jgi:dienelactone hydrolase
MRRLVLLLLLSLVALPAWAQTQLVPAYPDPIKGPAAAHGAVIWNHGLSQEFADSTSETAAVMELFRDAGWDVYRLNRGIVSDREEDSTQALLSAIDGLKAQGYAKLVTAGQSFGSWISLTAAGRTDKLSAVLVNAPAAYGDSSKKGYERNGTLLFPKLEALPHIPVVIGFYSRDLYDPGGRGPEAERILTARGVPHLIIDRPAVLEGHRSGSSVYFARRFGPCWLAVAETGQVPPLAQCETHWGDAPSADLKLPADLAITPGGLAGKWYGNYTSGREVMVVVTRNEGAAAEGLFLTGKETGEDGGSHRFMGEVSGGALGFTEPSGVHLTLTPAADGSASLLWQSADGRHRLGAVLHRLP